MKSLILFKIVLVLFLCSLAHKTGEPKKKQDSHKYCSPKIDSIEAKFYRDIDSIKVVLNEKP